MLLVCEVCSLPFERKKWSKCCDTPECVAEVANRTQLIDQLEPINPSLLMTYELWAGTQRPVDAPGSGARPRKPKKWNYIYCRICSKPFRINLETTTDLFPYCKKVRCQQLRVEGKLVSNKTSMMKTYGLTSSDYDSLIETFPSCGICGSTDKLVIDHCHQTGKVRGRLCHIHNVGLGMFQDTIELLQKAIDYLSSPYDFRSKR